MNIRSLQYQTDLDILSFDGQIDDRGTYLRVVSPAQPTFHWGNLLLFPEPPEVGDFDRWCALYQKEFADYPNVRHITFGWDGIDGGIGQADPFLADGFKLDRSTVLIAEAGTPAPSPVANGDVEIRPLTEDAHWVAHIEIQASDPQDYDPVSHLAFVRNRSLTQKAIVQAGLGQWFGAFLDTQLVASCGLVVREGRGRFQTVATHPEFRRQGICSRMVFEVARVAGDELGAEKLVIVAEADSPAGRIYESLGFVPSEHSAGLCKWKHARTS